MAETVVELLERARIAGLTQQKIAVALGVSDRQVRRWAAGEADMRLSHYQGLIKLLNGSAKPV